MLPNTEAVACEAGVCIHACQEGFVDLNADLNTERSDGCECVVSPELCDGLDNDCDGAIDDDDPDLPPADELCDGIDNDCDGLTDADDPDLLPADELCDGIDNDCDDLTDADDPDLDLARDCGATTGAQATCLAGACAFACALGLVDVNGDLDLGPDGDGCECQPTTPSTETCDGIDNDCDGTADNPNAPDLLDNCPSVDNASPVSCADGACVFGCQLGFVDVNDDLNQPNSDGCECQRDTPADEFCDGIDNDCDGTIDNPDAPDLLDRCPSSTNAAPVACADGACTLACADGFVDANGDLNQPTNDGCECLPSEPSTEVCDGLDNDCDAAIDADDPDFNPSTCPAVPGAQALTCTDGACAFACATGFVDINGDLDQGNQGDGCECQRDTPSTEVCDGIDNDCDGAIDADDDNFAPDLCALQRGVCQGATALCLQGRSIDCDEARYLNNDATFTGLDDTIELVCDGVDNNCRGDNDENCCLPGQGLFNVADPQLEGAIQFAPSIAASNQGVILTAWEEDVTPGLNTHRVRFRKFDTLGVPLGPPGFINTGREPTVIRVEDEFWIINTRGSDIATALNKITLSDRNFQSDLDLRLVFDLVQIQHPAVAARSKQDALVAWSRTTSRLGPCTNRDAVACVRAGVPNGPIDNNALIELSEPSGAIEAVTPAVLPAGAGWLVVWQDVSEGSRAVKWVVLDAQRRPTGPIRLQPAATSAQHPLDVVPTEDGFLIVYAQFCCFGGFSINALPIDHEGAPLGEETDVAVQNGSQILSHRIVPLRGGLGVMWAGGQVVNVRPGGVFLRRIDERGIPSGPPIELLEVRNQRPDAVAVAPVPDFGVAVMHAIMDRRGVERARWSLLNLDGDALCLE